MTADITFDDTDSQSAPERQLGLFVNLEGFEGPIDLLLSLAREQKLDIAKIAILPLAEQYLDYISTARELNLEVARSEVSFVGIDAIKEFNWIFVILTVLASNLLSM